ncbi:MAG: imelysin family protein [Cyanobacteria bacterium J06559_1]
MFLDRPLSGSILSGSILSGSLLLNGLTISPALAEGSVVISDAIAPSEAMHQLNSSFASAVIIPTYTDLVSHTQALVETAAAFESDPSELTLYSLRNAWLSSASAWAEGYAFAFGPVHSLGHAAALEFPADPLGIETLMADPEAINWDDAGLLPSVQGFEAIAYLLHGPNGDKALSDFSDQERRYITWLARSTRQVSGDLLAVWQLGIDDQPAYKAVLASAGEPGNGAYLSPASGTEEIVRGLMNCLEVVALEGLPEMLSEPQALTQYSGQRSLELLRSTLQGAQTAYLGSVVTEASVPARALTIEAIRSGEIHADASHADTSRAGGLSDWVGMANAHTDAQIQQSLTVALENVNQAMANPRDVDALSESLSLAHSSLLTTQALLETDVLPLLQP